MSLDVYLKSAQPITKKSTGIFIRQEGSTKEVTVEEWNSLNPDRAITVGDIEESEYESEYVYEANITHNMGVMAGECGVYEVVWHPNAYGITTAQQLIQPLTEAIKKLKADPEYYEQFNPPNKWGNYKALLLFLENYLEACKENPDALVSVSR
jgi:hypothetical protein